MVKAAGQAMRSAAAVATTILGASLPLTGCALVLDLQDLKDRTADAGAVGDDVAPDGNSQNQPYDADVTVDGASDRVQDGDTPSETTTTPPDAAALDGGSRDSGSDAHSASDASDSGLDASEDAQEAGGCASSTQETLAIHIKLSVTWAADATIQASNGPQPVDIWLRADLGVNGTALTGSAKICGLGVPATHLTALLNSETNQLLFDNSIWERMPTFAVTGSQNGWSVGSSLALNPAVALLGLNPTGATSPYANASTAWPPPSATNGSSASFPQFASTALSDDDDDGAPGVSMLCSTASGDSDVLTSINTSDISDRLFTVWRIEASLSGILTSCGVSAGTAVVSLFENHVVGCHDAPGSAASECATMLTGTGGGPGFVDASRTLYVPGSATYVSQSMPVGSACSTVRSVLP